MLLAVAFLFVAPAPAPAQVPAHPRDLKYPPLSYTPPNPANYRHVLKNGVVAFMAEDHELPLVTVSVTIRVGPYFDPPGKEGLASAVGSQLRAGGAGSWSAEEFDEEADFLAANLASSIGATSATASVNCLAKDLDRALELFFAMIRRPAFQEDRLELFKSQELQGIERRNDRTDEIEDREWNRLLRGDRHFTNAWSTKASISSLTRQDLLEFHGKHFHPRNFIFAVAGDFRRDEMKAKLEAAMAGWESPAGPVTAIPKPEHSPTPGLYLVHKPDVNQGRISIGHLGILRGNPDEFALDLMNDILGGSAFTSRITNRVRSSEGLAYSAGSSFTTGVYYEGQFRASFQSKSHTCAEAAKIVLEEIDRIRKEKVTSEELSTVKSYAVEVFPRYFSSATAIVRTFADDEFTGRDPKYWETYRDRIRAVTEEDVLRVARKYLHPDRLVILAVGNVEDLLKGNPEKAEYSLTGLVAEGKVTRIPLPDPNTMQYPKTNSPQRE